MVRRAAWLREAGLTAWANAITSREGNAKPINARSSTQDGLNPSFISLDESHAQNFELHDVLKSAQGARVNPLLIAPTTAGYSLTSGTVHMVGRKSSIKTRIGGPEGLLLGLAQEFG